MMGSVLRLAVSILALSGLLSCASTPETVVTEHEDFQEYWPEPPEIPRYRYIASFYNSGDLEEKTADDKLREMVLGKSPLKFVIKHPLAVAGASGVIYLIDGQHPSVNVFDFRRRRYFRFGYRLEGKLIRPVSVAVDGKGFVYVADRGQSRIVVYDSIGLYRRHIDLSGVATQLAGITFDRRSEHLYVVDRGGIDSRVHQVIKLTGKGEVVARFGERGAGPRQFNLPLDIAIDSRDRLHVLDAGNFRVQVLDAEGEFLHSWGSVGNSLGQFGQPRSIAIDADDNVYVSDTQFGNVQVFNPDGRLLLPIGSLAQDDIPGRFSLITGINIDAKGYLYALDQFLGKMEIYQKLSAEQQQKVMVEYRRKEQQEGGK